MAAVAAIAAVSCNKIENEQASTVRTVTAGFDQETRTSLSGNHVSWEVGDEIKVMNEAGGSELHTIVAKDLNDGKVTFTTTLTGQLYAIYGGTEASVVEGEVSFTIPSSQSGAFKDANICVAKLDANNHFAFKNATAILHFVNCDAEFPNTYITGQGKSATLSAINITTLDSVTSSFSPTFSVQSSGDALGIAISGTLSSECYFAVSSGECKFTVTIENNKGSKTSVEKTKSLVRNMIYTIDVKNCF